MSCALTHAASNERVLGAPAIDAHGVEQHGVEQLPSAIRLDAEIIQETLGKQVGFLEIAPFELGEPFGAHVCLDNGEQKVTVGEVVAVAIELLGPDLGKHFVRIGAAVRVGGEQR